MGIEWEPATPDRIFPDPGRFGTVFQTAPRGSA